MVQGAAAELFKVWAVTVRARGRALDARVVLCLHDELLVHVPIEHADAAAALVDDALQEAAARWAPDRTVRFLAEGAEVPESGYDRLVVLFDGNDEDAVARARSLWSAAKARGDDITYWQQGDTGRWERKR